jgi:hypothetical protein
MTDEVKAVRTEVDALGRLQIEQSAWLVEVVEAAGRRQPSPAKPASLQQAEDVARARP